VDLRTTIQHIFRPEEVGGGIRSRHLPHLSLVILPLFPTTGLRYLLGCDRGDVHADGFWEANEDSVEDVRSLLSDSFKRQGMKMPEAQGHGLLA